MSETEGIVKKEKELRRISIEACPEIGRGAHGIVYRIAPDMLVKVYHPDISLDRIKKERELARWAFVKGVPTAIPFDIVRVGEQYGTVFELLDATSSVDYIGEAHENLEDFIRQSVELMKRVHAVEAGKGELPDMKQQTLGWLEKVKGELPDELFSRLQRLVNDVPDRMTILHADFHLKNIMVAGEGLMLIDMDTLCTGDPIFELSTVYVSYRQFPSIDPVAAEILGIDVDTAAYISDRTFELYLDEIDRKTMEDTVRKARILGCVRIIDYMDRHREHPATEMCVSRCLQDLKRDLEELRGS
ncbi:MAG: phosphotransferase [Eubacterium sp.]|nr:phosphotransferase [Eubacterium sp.]